MLNLTIILNLEVLSSELMMANTFAYPNTVIGLVCLLFLLIIIISGYMVSNLLDRMRMFKVDFSHKKSFGEILKYECEERLWKHLNLDVFTNGLHCLAHNVSVYYRKQNMEYIVVLNTDRGYLVGRYFDSMNAEKEFLFICKEDEAENRGEIDVKINFFDYKLYSK